MPIKAGDVKLVASRVMDDVPEGGGAPTSVVIEDNANNAIFRDISEVDRAGGRLNMAKVNVSIQTPDRDTFLGGNVIVGSPPDDPNVHVTIFKADGPFEVRRDAVSKVESYLGRGSRLSGFLLENHVLGQRNIQLFQRPGTPTPALGRSLVLLYDEGLPTERSQYVRVINLTVETRMFSEQVSNQLVDFLADVVTLELSDALRYDFPGSPPSRFFAMTPNKTMVRDTVVADAGRYYGAAPLAATAAVGDTRVKATTPYAQLVPSARTETVALDQKPAAQRTLVLADTPRRVEIGVAPHTQRIKIGQENRGYNFVFMLKPLPARNTIVISYMALGNWYTAFDDGAGALTGSAAGQVIYTTGSMALTLPVLPDAGSAIIVSWGEAVGYTSRAAQGGSVRAPEYCWLLEEPGVIPGSITLTWTSRNITLSASDDGAGRITGSGGATGIVDYPSGTILMRPGGTGLLDPGADILVSYEVDAVITENATPGAPDAAGLISVATAQQPAAGTVEVQWITARTVSETSGGTLTAIGQIKDTSVTYTSISVPEYYEPVKSGPPVSACPDGYCVIVKNAGTP